MKIGQRAHPAARGGGWVVAPPVDVDVYRTPMHTVLATPFFLLLLFCLPTLLTQYVLESIEVESILTQSNPRRCMSIRTRPYGN